MICLISRPILIASRRDWYQSKCLLKGFKLALRPWESSKNWWRYGQMKFVTTKPQVFGGKMEEVSAFINAACLYLRIKMMDEAATTQVVWVLSYVQGGVAEA